MQRTILHLSLINGVGPATIDKLVKKFKDIRNIYNARYSDLIELGISPAVAKNIIDALSNKSILEQELELIAKYNFGFVTKFDDSYPEILRSIHLPPTVLYYWGAKLRKNLNKTLAIVGSRKSDNYGKNAIKYLCNSIVQEDWTIISGGALGIDKYAHLLAVENKKPTIAVLGSGLLKIYPQENRALFNAIVENGGTIISPFSLNTGPFAANFPARNRIIAGLARATLVIQAAEKSGALITAHYALEQGREVGAVPGPIDSPISAGCHNLISQGAALIGSEQELRYLLEQTTPVYSQDIYSQNNYLQNDPNILSSNNLNIYLQNEQNILSSNNLNIFEKNNITQNIINNFIDSGPNNINNNKNLAQTGEQDSTDLVNNFTNNFENSKANISTNLESNKASSPESEILILCAKVLSFDELLEETKFNRQELTSSLLQLQLEGKIEQNSMGLWYRL